MIEGFSHEGFAGVERRGKLGDRAEGVEGSFGLAGKLDPHLAEARDSEAHLLGEDLANCVGLLISAGGLENIKSGTLDETAGTTIEETSGGRELVDDGLGSDHPAAAPA